MKLTRYLFFLLLLIACTEKEAVDPITAQLPEDAGALENLLDSTDDNNTKLSVLWELYKINKSQNERLASQYLEDLLELADFEGNTLYQGKAYHGFGTIAISKDDYIIALNNYLTAIECFKSDNNLPYLADDLNNIGVVFMESGNFDYAIEFFSKAKEYYLSTGDTRFLLLVNVNLGICHFSKINPDFSIAEFAFQEALDLTNQLGKKKLYYLNRIHNQIGTMYFHQSKYNKAISSYMMSLEYISDDGDTEGQKAVAYANIGEVYLKLRNFDEAEKWLDQAYGLTDKIGVAQSQRVVGILNIMGELYQLQGRYGESRKYLEQAVEVANKEVINEALQETLRLLRISYKNIGKSGRAVSAGQYDQILELDAKQDELKDEMSKKTNYKALQSALNLRIELNNERRAKEAEHELKILYIILAITMLLLGVVSTLLLLVKNRRIRAEYRNNEKNLAEGVNRLNNWEDADTESHFKWLRSKRM